MKMYSVLLALLVSIISTTRFADHALAQGMGASCRNVTQRIDVLSGRIEMFRGRLRTLDVDHRLSIRERRAARARANARIRTAQQRLNELLRQCLNDMDDRMM